MVSQCRPTHSMARIYVPALVLYGFCLTPVILVSPPPSVVVHPGDNVTLQCTDVLKGPGHVSWFKQVNVSEPLCIASMYSSQAYVKHHNGFQPSHMEMFISNRIIVLKITEVDVADSGLYCCGMYDQYFIFTNMTFLMVKGYKDSDKEPEQCSEGQDDDGTMYLLTLVVILVVVTAVLLIVILILVLKIRRDTNRHNTGPDSQRQPQNDQNQDPDSLIYAALNFTSKKRKMERRREKELDPHVVYAATR
ncbi:uncharacterized protein LOC118392724 isoform X1 [Oncorhynchus keta]|uniref:uncharacterized protein LOC118392724 isoform X1 n=1 Tax=Oncorhynchus keta TaxID=8018 RepID=UPI00227B1529|nr:uncharacterized protein LOC118392724 isoform X1 [Oncorhynchus keta]